MTVQEFSPGFSADLVVQLVVASGLCDSVETAALLLDLDVVRLDSLSDGRVLVTVNGRQGIVDATVASPN